MIDRYSDNTNRFFLLVGLAVFVVVASYGGYKLQQTVYASGVRDVMCEMIKPEHLKNPNVCEEE